MQDVFSIGESEPFKLGKEACQRLVLAICTTHAEVITASIDKTCPPTHGCFRVKLDVAQKENFEAIALLELEPVELASGQ